MQKVMTDRINAENVTPSGWIRDGGIQVFDVTSDRKRGDDGTHRFRTDASEPFRDMNDFYERFQPRLTADEFEEAVELLVDRWMRNELSFSLIEDKRILDMGCRSGRYSYALSKLGAEEVVAVDAETPTVPEEIDASGVEFRAGDVLQLPVEDGEFDFVYCNGTLTHIEEWIRGIEEARRVLKPGGWLWLYVACEHSSWDPIDNIRTKMTQEDAEVFKRYLLWRGVRPGRAFWLTDIFFVDERYYRTREEVKYALNEQGFKDLRFLGDFSGCRTETGLRVLAKKPAP